MTRMQLNNCFSLLKGHESCYNTQMKQKILAFAFLALYVLISYVPPSAEALAMSAKGEQLPALGLVGRIEFPLQISLPNGSDISLPVASVNSFIRETFARGSEAIKSLPSAEQARGKVGGAVEMVKSAANTGLQVSRKVVAASKQIRTVADALKLEPDPTIRQHLQLTEWAEQKSDVHACEQLNPVVLDERTVNGRVLPTPTPGDFLAYCLARVTHDGARCTQIGDGTFPPLKSLCDNELKI